jgi:tRNA dimethylallyltransferase
VGADPVRVAATAPASPLAVCIFGPTGTGKTELALRLADAFPLEVISVDSAMVYRGLDIGTAKPGPESRTAVPHHLIDIREPWEVYSAGQFRTDALRLIDEIRARERLPLLVGGTLLYFRGLLRGLAPLPAADPGLRDLIEREAGRRGWPALHAELARVDPASAGRIKPLDRQRIQRALEVFRLTGAPLSRLQAWDKPVPDIRYLRIALRPVDRRALYQRLDERLKTMLRCGLIAEVQRLRSMPLMTADAPAMRAVGYRQIWQYLAGEYDREEAERRAAVATRRLAKRQLTWMRTETADLEIETPAEDAAVRVGALLQEAGVSRRTLQCNIMGPPTERREHGV